MKEKNPLKIYLIIGLVLSLLIFLVLFLVLRNQEPAVDCRPDSASGETICHTEYEVEDGGEPKQTNFIGLSILDSSGFSNSQQDAILDFLRSYFKDYDTMSYQKDSFTYDPVEIDGILDFSKSHFKMISSTNETFTVHLDTKNSISSISVSAEKTN